METSDLIHALVANAAPVRRLPHPMMHAAIWLVLSAAYVAAVIMAYSMLGASIVWSGDGRFLV